MMTYWDKKKGNIAQWNTAARAQKKWNAAILALIEAGSGDEIQLQAQNTERERGGMQNK